MSEKTTSKKTEQVESVENNITDNQNKLSKDEFDNILNLLDKTANEKLANVRDFVSPLITIVVGILAVILAINVTPNTLWFFAIIGLYLIACIIMILFAYKPKEFYPYLTPNNNKKTNKKNDKIENFDILKFETFNIPDKVFEKKLKEIKQADLTPFETKKIALLKQNINEYYYKKQKTKNVYLAIIIGSVILAILFIIAMFI